MGIGIQILRQVLLGVGISAGQAVVETGQQLTIKTLTAKLQEWNINIDVNSPLGMLFDNFKSNLGFQMTNEMMMFTNSHCNKIIDDLQNQSMRNREDIQNQAFALAESGASAWAKKKFFPKYWGNNVTVTDIAKGESVAVANPLLHQNEIETSNIKSLALSQINAVGTRAGNFTSSIGINNNTFAHSADISDDTRFFDAVQYLINMKKVG